MISPCMLFRNNNGKANIEQKKQQKMDQQKLEKKSMQLWKSRFVIFVINLITWKKIIILEKII